jgi:hypothetical protein
MPFASTRLGAAPASIPLRFRTDPNEFAVFVGTGEQNDSDFEHVARGYFRRIGRGRLKDKFVFADFHGTDQHGVELLIELLILCAADIDQLPLELCTGSSTSRGVPSSSIHTADASRHPHNHHNRQRYEVDWRGRLRGGAVPDKTGKRQENRSADGLARGPAIAQEGAEG